MIIFILTLILLSFGLIVLIGAPYLPTLKQQQQQALDLLNLNKGQVLLDLGSGDGRLLLLAGRQGIKSVGIEANPFLVVISKILTWRYRKLITIKWANYWSNNWPPADGIYVFLHERFMHKLHKKIIQNYKGKNVSVVSYAFKITDKKAVKTVGPMFLYKY